VDLVGKEFGWIVENFDNVTKTSALMVNEEKIAIYQDAGEKDWCHTQLPKNVSLIENMEKIKSVEFKAALIISDNVVIDSEIIAKSVVYRPKSLVVGIGLHWDTQNEAIREGITAIFKENGLSLQSIRNIASIDRGVKVKGLEEFSRQHDIPVELFAKDKLATVNVPNPSLTVHKFEGTPSVAEASCLLSTKGQ
jgi:cobalt-precorrin 5A hydrolase